MSNLTTEGLDAMAYDDPRAHLDELQRNKRDAGVQITEAEWEIGWVEEKLRYPGLTVGQIASVRQLIKDESRKAWGQKP